MSYRHFRRRCGASRYWTLLYVQRSALKRNSALGPGVIRPSVASIVYSMSSNFNQYNAIVRPQDCRTETIAELKDMMKEAVYAFAKVNGAPARVIFLRDGISEGEFESVGKSEIDQIKGMKCNSTSTYHTDNTSQLRSMKSGKSRRARLGSRCRIRNQSSVSSSSANATTWPSSLQGVH